MPHLHKLYYDAILSVLRNPDDSMDCYQSFWSRKLLNPEFQRKIQMIPESGRDPYLYQCARRFAQDWRRTIHARQWREAPLDPCRPPESVCANLANQLLARLRFAGSLTELRRRAADIVEKLSRSGEAAPLVRAIIDQSRAKGLTAFGTLIAIYSAVFLGLGLPGALRAVRKSAAWGAVNAHRVRRRLGKLRPYIRGDAPWPHEISL